LARNGTITNAEFKAALSELGSMAVVDELTLGDAPGPDEIFDDLVRRLGEVPD
jgi:hypothetical protein